MWNLRASQITEGVTQEEKDAFTALLKKHKISPKEYERIKVILGRKPTLSEVGVFSAMWSEHCSYKSSKVHLRRFPTTGENVVVGPGENAGVVRLHKKLCLAFKMESHNHPSYIEPYHGAATGVGGILRDVFCMGARPFANLNCLRFGEKSHPRTAYLVERVSKGIADYGNCIGVATVGGNVAYDKSYNGNCLVNAMNLGLIREDKIFKGFASGVGNLVVYVGSATGRDGIHGASMASDSFSQSIKNEQNTVQVGDPYAEKLLLEATLEVLEKGLVVGIQDMGAAGLTSSSFEMAGRAGNGVDIDLTKVPLRAKNMTAYEILLSESQERMLMVIRPEAWQELSEVLSKWNLSHAVIGKVTDTGIVRVAYQNVLEVEVSVGPLTDQAPVYEKPMADRLERRSDSFKELEDMARSSDVSLRQGLLAKIISDSGSQRKIYQQFDRSIGNATVFTSDDGGAAVYWVRDDDVSTEAPWLGVVMAAGCLERKVRLDPHRGAAETVAKLCRDIVASGGRPLAMTDCLNFGNPDDPQIMREFSDAVDGISEAARELQVPVVSGNVSLYNSTDGVSILPTPMIGVVGRIDDVRQAKPAVCQKSFELYLLEPVHPKKSFGGSMAAKIAGISAETGRLESHDWKKEKSAFSLLHEMSSKLCAVRPVGRGGWMAAALKMMAGSKIFERRQSFDARVALHDESFEDALGEAYASYVLEFASSPSSELWMKNISTLGFQLRKVSSLVQSTTKEASSQMISNHFGAWSFDDLNRWWSETHDFH